MTEDNIEPIPLRLDMLPEIAAIALPSGEEGEQPTVAINSRELDQRATFSLFKEALVGVVMGWSGSRAGRWAHKHQVITTAITTVAVGSVGVIGVNAALAPDEQPVAIPQPTVTVAVTQSPATFTLPPVRQTVTVAPPTTTATAAAPARTRRNSAPTRAARSSPSRAPARRDSATATTSKPATESRDTEPTTDATKAPHPASSSSPQASDAAAGDMRPVSSGRPAPSGSTSEETLDPGESGPAQGEPTRDEPPSNAGPSCFIELDVLHREVCVRVNL